MDTFLPVDYQKSIEKQRLVYKRSSDSTFEYVLFYLVMITVLGSSLAGVFIPVVLGDFTVIYIIPIVLLFDAWFVANAILLNAFIKIKGNQTKDHKKDIIKAIGESLELENLDQPETNMIRDVRLSGFLQSGRVVTCVFDQDTIYLNITSLMRGNALSIFGGLYNYYRCKSIAEDFKEWVQTSGK